MDAVDYVTFANLVTVNEAMRGILLDVLEVQLMCVGQGHADASAFLAELHQPIFDLWEEREPPGTEKERHSEEAVMQRERSPAYEILRPSSRRLLRVIDTELARNGGATIIHNDQFEVVGSSTRVVLPGLAELHALGLIEVTRYPKRCRVASSRRWQEITTADQARATSVAAREERPPVVTPVARRHGPGHDAQGPS